LNAADVFFDELLELRHELQVGVSVSPRQVTEHCIKRLSQIIGDNKALFDDSPDEMKQGGIDAKVIAS
ncbi:MAG: hypothetical protein ABW072_13185, partial [Sedimenticola sp.]